LGFSVGKILRSKTERQRSRIISLLCETENIIKFGVNPKLVENFNEWNECSFELCMGERKIIDKTREQKCWSVVEEKLRLTYVMHSSPREHTFFWGCEQSWRDPRRSPERAEHSGSKAQELPTLFSLLK